MVKAVAYSPEHRTLHCKFHDGKHYAYIDVDPEFYDRFINADSIGTFFVQNIRGQLRHRMVTDE